MTSYPMLLLVIPIIFALLYLVKNDAKYYRVISVLMCGILSVLSILLALQGEQQIEISGGLYSTIQMAIIVLEFYITGFIIYKAVKHKRYGVFALALVQACLSIYSLVFVEGGELFRNGASVSLNIDKLSIVMGLIINIVGTLIVVFANSYMNHYEEHRHLKNKQRMFYSLIAVFLAAMNGIIFADELSWLFFFWEVTTIISFMLISYNGDEEAMNSGFRALFLNVIGGISFTLGIILLNNMMGIKTLTEIIHNGKVSQAYILPVFLICIAGFVKSAQVPFQSWLLGAMVAPTPVSALLHSSTMVKAGVFLIIKLAPAYAGTSLGTMIAIYGGFTFLVCSYIAIAQRNAKRILAYSTIANLGLIIASAGMGSSIAISAAMMLLIFHAVSKALLFLCAGQIEHTIGSRDVEDMHGLIDKAPVLTILTALGMLSMLLPPFGVLITKWISIEAAASNPLVAVFLILGSAFTTVYYIKWLATILAKPTESLKPKRHIDPFSIVPVSALGVVILAASVLITQIFNIFVSPEVKTLLKAQNQLVGANGKVYSGIGSFNDANIFLVLLVILAVVLVARKYFFQPKIKKVYLCGENNSDENFNVNFRNGLAQYEESNVSNLYLAKIINEPVITYASNVITFLFLIIVLTGGLICLR